MTWICDDRIKLTIFTFYIKIQFQNLLMGNLAVAHDLTEKMMQEESGKYDKNIRLLEDLCHRSRESHNRE